MPSTVSTRHTRTDASGAVTSHLSTRRSSAATSGKSGSWCCFTSGGGDEDNPPPRSPKARPPRTTRQAVQRTQSALASSHTNEIVSPNAPTCPSTCQSVTLPEPTGDGLEGFSNVTRRITITGRPGNYEMLVEGDDLFVFHEGLTSANSAGNGNMITDEPLDKDLKFPSKTFYAKVTVSQHGKKYKVVVAGGHVGFNVPEAFSVERE